jgi:nucleoid DNA-binding protein
VIMIDYIVEILEHNNRVIIPELGAFIVKQRVPLLIIFNEFLQYNDGILVDIIAKKENIDCNEAKLKLDQFTNHIKSAINSGEYFAFDKLGDLVKTPSGKITLCEPNVVFERSILYQENEIAIEIEEPPLSISEEKFETKEIITETESEVSIPKQTKPVEIEKTEHELEKREVEKSVEEFTRPVKEKEIKKEPTSEIEIPKPFITTPEANVNHQPSSTKTRSIIIWTFLILLVNGIIAGIFFKTPISGLFKKNVENLTPIVVSDSLAKTENINTPSVDTILKEEKTSRTAIQTKEIPDQQKVTKGYRYFIVAGVFRSEVNADKLIADLQKKGFKPEKFGKIGELYGVSYESFTLKEEAEKALIKIKSETDPGAWIKTINY